MSPPLKLVVGIGNPGAQYARTRHNVGVWFVSRFADQQAATFKEEKTFFGQVATTRVDDQEVKLLIPNTYMNESGKSVGALAHFFKIMPEEILIVHDELDLATGIIRFKQGGGLAGHNGLRDIARSLGGAQHFNRLRIGVGHPGSKEQVTGHVLGTVSQKDEDTIWRCIEEGLHHIPMVVRGDWQPAMNTLNGFRVEE